MNNFASLLKKSFTVCFAIALVVFASGTAHAQILLQVEILNPSTVTITATGNLILPGNNVAPYDVFDGVDLLGFFADPRNKGDIITVADSPQLTTVKGENLVALAEAATDDYSGGGHHDLNLFNSNDGNGADTIAFDENTQAFTGSLTLNLSQLNLTVASFSSGGKILAGYSGDGQQVKIGDWAVVEAPEPSTWMLLAGSLVLLPIVRHFRRT